MNQNRQFTAEPRQVRPTDPDRARSADPGASEAAIDHERLIWDPEYRQEVAHLLRQPAAPRR
jgi:hypothetical protein